MTIPEPGIVIIIACLLLITLMLAGWMIRRGFAGQRESFEQQKNLIAIQEQINATARETSRRIDQMAEAIQTVHLHMARSVEAGRKSVDDRLNSTTQVIQSISTQLGQIDESSKSLLAMSRDISELQNILRAPKLRGNLGELFLHELLSQMLPAGQFRMQHMFQGGEKVDAVILLQSGMVPVDAKFPLENFRKFAAAAGDEERRGFRKLFLRDLKIHIDVIAGKYIRPDEGTFPFAMMYIPAENVYYEAILRDGESDSGDGPLHYALQKNVIPVSPNSFYAYLHTILIGLRGLRVEEHAREIIDHLDRLRQDIARYGESFRLVGVHLDNARKKFEDAVQQFMRLENRFDAIDRTINADPPANASDTSQHA